MGGWGTLRWAWRAALGELMDARAQVRRVGVNLDQAVAELHVTAARWRPMSTARTRREAAALLRRLLAAVEAGELEAEDGQGVAVVRHWEGAAVALEQTT